MKHRQTRYCWLLLCIVVCCLDNLTTQQQSQRLLWEILFWGSWWILGYIIYFSCAFWMPYMHCYIMIVFHHVSLVPHPLDFPWIVDVWRTCRHPASAFCARAGIMKWHRGCKGWQHLFQAVHHIFNLVAVEVGTTDDDHLLLPSSTPQVPKS